MAPIRILITGLDAESAARNTPGLDGAALKKDLEESLALVRAEADIHLEMCWLFLEDTQPTERLRERLSSEAPYDGIVVGWGVRGLPEHSVLFEDCLDVMRRYAPAQTKFLFSTTTGNHLETIRRGFRNR